MPTSTRSRDDEQRLAVTALLWYLLNLLALPVIGFAVLVWLYSRHADRPWGKARQRLRWSVIASLLGAGSISLALGVSYLALGTTPAGWTAMLLAAICLHTGFVLAGMIQLGRTIGST